MTSETLTSEHSSWFSEAEVQSITHLMEVWQTKLPKERKQKLLAEGVKQHCQLVLGGEE